MLKRQQFLESNEVQIKLINVEKKMMHRQRFVIDVIIDKKIEQIKKTYRQFRYFNKIINQKMGIKELLLPKALWSAQRYKNLEVYIHKLNSGYLYYHQRNPKAKQVRNYVYNLLFLQDALFVDGVDDSSDEENNRQRKNTSPIKTQQIQRKRSNGQFNGDLKNSLKNTIKNMYYRKNSLQSMENSSLKSILKRIKKCWLKYPDSYQKREKDEIFYGYHWEEYDMVLHENYISFVGDTDRRLVLLINCRVQLSFSDYTKLLIYHEIDDEKIEIRLRKELNQKEDGDIYEKYLALYTHIKEISNSFRNFHIQNKVKIRLSLKKNMKSELQKKNVKQMNIKVIHGPILLFFGLQFESVTDLYMPIIDNFGHIQIHVTQNRQNSFLPNINLMQSSSSFSIPVQSIYDYIYNHNKPKKKQAEIKNKHIQLKNTKVNMQMQYKMQGNLYSMCSYEQKDIYQGQDPPQQFNREELRMHNNRLKRIMWTIQLWMVNIKDLQNFTYPKMSYFFYFILALFVLFYDHNYFIMALAILLLAVLTYNNSSFHIYCSEIINLLHLQKFVKTIKSILMKKSSWIEKEYVVKKQTMEKQDFLLHFELTRKNKRNIYKKLKRFQEMLLKSQYLLLIIVSTIEKIKNLFTWYYYEKTKIFFLILVAITLSFLLLPIRYLILGGLFKMIKKGLAYHKRTQEMNKIIILQLFKVLINENNLKHIQQFYMNQQKQLDKNHAEYVVFIKKVKDLLTNTLNLHLNEEVFQESQCFKDLVNKICKSKSKFTIPIDVCNKHGFSPQWSKTKSTVPQIFSLMYGFLVTIPSDKHIMGVKTVHENEDQDDEDEEIL